jgi:hypothetical protein
MYGEIVRIYNLIPKGFLKEKTEMRAKLLLLYKKVMINSDLLFLSNTTEATKSKYDKLLKLLVTMQTHVEKREFDLIEVAYNHVIGLYNELPIGFVQQNITIRDEIIKAYDIVQLYKKLLVLDSFAKTKDYASLKRLIENVRRLQKELRDSCREYEQVFAYADEKMKEYNGLISAYYLDVKPQFSTAPETRKTEAEKFRKDVDKIMKSFPKVEVIPEAKKEKVPEPAKFTPIVPKKAQPEKIEAKEKPKTAVAQVPEKPQEISKPVIKEAQKIQQVAPAVKAEPVKIEAPKPIQKVEQPLKDSYAPNIDEFLKQVDSRMAKEPQQTVKEVQKTEEKPAANKDLFKALVKVELRQQPKTEVRPKQQHEKIDFKFEAKKLEEEKLARVVSHDNSVHVEKLQKDLLPLLKQEKLVDAAESMRKMLVLKPSESLQNMLYVVQQVNRMQPDNKERQVIMKLLASAHKRSNVDAEIIKSKLARGLSFYLSGKVADSKADLVKVAELMQNEDSKKFVAIVNSKLNIVEPEPVKHTGEFAFSKEGKAEVKQAVRTLPSVEVQLIKMKLERVRKNIDEGNNSKAEEEINKILEIDKNNQEAKALLQRVKK